MEDTIKHIVNSLLKDTDYFLIDIEITGSRSNKVVNVYIDGRDYVNLDNLGEINKEIREKITEENKESDISKLIVSSPGTDRSFKYIGQLHKHTGRRLEIEMKDGKKFSGELLKVNEESGTLTIKNIKKEKGRNKEYEVIEIDFNKIKISKTSLIF